MTKMTTNKKFNQNVFPISIDLKTTTDTIVPKIKNQTFMMKINNTWEHYLAKKPLQLVPFISTSFTINKIKNALNTWVIKNP